MTPQGEQGEERVVLWRYRRLAHPVWNDERASRFTGSPDQIEVATFQRIPSDGSRVVVLSEEEADLAAIVFQDPLIDTPFNAHDNAVRLVILDKLRAALESSS